MIAQQGSLASLLRGMVWRRTCERCWWHGVLHRGNWYVQATHQSFDYLWDFSLSASALSSFGKPDLEVVPVINSYTFSAYSRFANFLGQCRQTRLKRSALVLFLSPWLFFAPEIYLMEMERLWTGKIIAKRVWKTFMTKLLSEWNDIILWVRFHV